MQQGGNVLPELVEGIYLLNILNEVYSGDFNQPITAMYWTFGLADYLNEAPWPATKKVLLDFCNRENVPTEVVDNINQLPDDDDVVYAGIEDLWVDHPKRSEYLHNDDEDAF